MLDFLQHACYFLTDFNQNWNQLEMFNITRKKKIQSCFMNTGRQKDKRSDFNNTHRDTSSNEDSIQGAKQGTWIGYATYLFLLCVSLKEAHCTSPVAAMQCC